MGFPVFFIPVRRSSVKINLFFINRIQFIIKLIDFSKRKHKKYLQEVRRTDTIRIENLAFAVKKQRKSGNHLSVIVTGIFIFVICFTLESDNTRKEVTIHSLWQMKKILAVETGRGVVSWHKIWIGRTWTFPIAG